MIAGLWLDDGQTTTAGAKSRFLPLIVGFLAVGTK